MKVSTKLTGTVKPVHRLGGQATTQARRPSAMNEAVSVGRTERWLPPYGDGLETSFTPACMHSRGGMPHAIVGAPVVRSPTRGS